MEVKKAGLFIYAVEMERVAKFYESVVGLERIVARPDIIILDGHGMQLLVHETPEFVAKEIEVKTPPEVRSDTALKFFFPVESLEAASEAVTENGGVVLEDIYSGPRFNVRNVTDPEGNVCQIRESK